MEISESKSTTFPPHSIQRTSERSERDDETLIRLGKVPVLKRNFGLLSMLGFSSTVMLTWEGVFALLAVGLLNGGFAGSVYGYILVWIGSMSAYSTMAELASMAPTAGGQYHWVAILAPSRVRVLLSYLVGWLTLLGWQSVVAAGAFLTAQQIQGLVILNHAEYTNDPWKIMLTFWAVILVAVLVNTIIARALPRLESLLLALHAIGYIAVLVPLLHYGPHGDPAAVFSSFTNGGQWTTQGLSFMVGLAGPQFSLTGVDSVVHMSEEIKDAEKIVPRAMVYGVAINGLLGFGALLAALFAIGDIDTVLASPTGYPFMTMFQQAVGSYAGASTMIAMIVIMNMAATLSFLASASRLTWSFARDQGIPGWRILRKVERTTALPVWAISLTCLVSVLLSLIILGSSLAFNDVLALTLAGIYSSYLIGNSLLLWRRMTGKIQPYSSQHNGLKNTLGASELSWGPWKIPEPWGTINNVFCCLYMTVLLFFSFWPTMNRPDASGMNYSSLLMGAGLIFCVIYYLVHGRKVFSGPLVEVNVVH